MRFFKFKSPAPSVWYALALEKESSSIGPGQLGQSYGRAKIVTVRRYLSNLSFLARFPLSSILYPCSNAHNSGLEWSFSKIQKPSLISLVCTSPRYKIQDNCSPRIKAMVVERGYPSKDFWSIRVQTLITQAWNGVSWKFKNLKSTVWGPLALWTVSIPPPWA